MEEKQVTKAVLCGLEQLVLGLRKNLGINDVVNLEAKDWERL